MDPRGKRSQHNSCSTDHSTHLQSCLAHRSLPSPEMHRIGPSFHCGNWCRFYTYAAPTKATCVTRSSIRRVCFPRAASKLVCMRRTHTHTHAVTTFSSATMPCRATYHIGFQWFRHDRRTIGVVTRLRSVVLYL